MKKRIITLKEIAKKLNLSISTVSRALNNHPDISEETKKKVNDLATSLNYIPNIFAKGFRSHKSNIIGVIVPNITHYFTTTLIRGIIEEASLQGYRVIVSESNNDVNKQTEMLNTMLQFGVDGVLMSISKMTRDVDDILKVLNTIPLILFDKASNKIPCTQVVINEEEAAYNVVEHLINTGKKRIAIIKESEYSYNSEKRYEGYLRALKENSIEIDDKIILSVDDISMRQGKRMTNVLLTLKEKPDAIFAITDTAAIGVIKTLKKINIKIPEDIAVVGFSNSLNSLIIEPKLTTVDQPGQKIGSTAVKYLIEEINNPNEIQVNKTIEIKTNLIIRDSSFKI
ncbi:LacI family DNA-binding transcriptional regulator [Winogradskyella sp. SYSU M77433]|uniref:LacI family DNA-binding transcriptional regulator n=1 Tax=Winogradskyella sp. SYSU M77433 TaxID=3042722 RepID=UPI00247FBEF8|nr:LacI family DNA-binding transcriptional regulator [Winogradskyella sp. SYSU M77433]MDH7912172.1 LacI family DNA-binding transcriptional regulator [Winogradskyella sp. SYSU M77433]